jgi:hypothetical protein
MNEPKIYREWMDKYGSFKEAESFEAYLEPYGSRDATVHRWSVIHVDASGEAVRIRCEDCGHEDYSVCYLNQLKDLGVNNPKKPIKAYGKDACMNGRKERCDECKGTGICDPEFCYAEEGEEHCSLCEGTSVCCFCDGTGYGEEIDGDERHLWIAYSLSDLRDGDMQGVRLMCKDCGVGDTFWTFSPNKCNGFPASCPCSSCNEIYDTSYQMRDLRYDTVKKLAETESFEASQSRILQEKQKPSNHIMNSPMLKGSIAFVVGFLIGGNMRR